jgi:acetolactate synthase-1/3 small subunit
VDLGEYSRRVFFPVICLPVTPMRHIISILLRNEAGALTRVASLFSTRGYNIESLNVANQLLKLIDVVSIFDLTEGDHIERELLLLKLRVEAEELARIQELVQTDGARILDDRLDSYTLELTGAAARLDNFINRAAVHAEIRSVVRSGPLAVRRGAPAHSSAA